MSAALQASNQTIKSKSPLFPCRQEEREVTGTKMNILTLHACYFIQPVRFLIQFICACDTWSKQTVNRSLTVQSITFRARYPRCPCESYASETVAILLVRFVLKAVFNLVLDHLGAFKMTHKEFGNLARVKNVVSYSLSPFEQRAFAGMSKSVGNVIRRVRGQIFFMAPAFITLALIYRWGSNYHHHTTRKNPKDFENDE